jgi:hypothetical protein
LKKNDYFSDETGTSREKQWPSSLTDTITTTWSERERLVMAFTTFQIVNIDSHFWQLFNTSIRARDDDIWRRTKIVEGQTCQIVHFNKS